jgi:hypothetical protein
MLNEATSTTVCGLRVGAVWSPTMDLLADPTWAAE